MIFQKKNLSVLSGEIEITKIFLKRKEDEYIRLKTEIEELEVEVQEL